MPFCKVRPRAGGGGAGGDCRRVEPLVKSSLDLRVNCCHFLFIDAIRTEIYTTYDVSYDNLEH